MLKNQITSVSLVFPHQLFERNPCIQKGRPIYLIEEFLFFKQFNFHKQKLLFHRASMKFYEDYLRKQDFSVVYIETGSDLSDVRMLIGFMQKQGVKEIHYTEVVDDWLERRIQSYASKHGIRLQTYNSPMFLNTMEELNDFFKDRQSFLQSSFYIHQRKKRSILVDKHNKPIGGKWSLDADNRQKYPVEKTPPFITFPVENTHVKEAKKYVMTNFASNPGEMPSTNIYPTTFKESKNWLVQFLENRFAEFGKYEDAIVFREHYLHHSLLSPLLNSGLITPFEVLKNALDVGSIKSIPLNSLEGFIRQIIGWREYIRAVYALKGREERTKNFWEFHRKIPDTFWAGTTGIEPVDLTIKKVLKKAYSHHIERLMVMGNFMLLCEFDPNEVYRWFMELFIDAFDWVMVPNVYGMSQFADGGLMATKPYISSSNYLMKMSDFNKGSWQEIWDALFWRFMHVHREFFLQNPRLAMLLQTFDKWPDQKRKKQIILSEKFLESLDKDLRSY